MTKEIDIEKFKNDSKRELVRITGYYDKVKAVKIAEELYEFALNIQDFNLKNFKWKKDQNKKERD